MFYGNVFKMTSFYNICNKISWTVAGFDHVTLHFATRPHYLPLLMQYIVMDVNHTLQICPILTEFLGILSWLLNMVAAEQKMLNGLFWKVADRQLVLLINYEDFNALT